MKSTTEVHHTQSTVIARKSIEEAAEACVPAGAMPRWTLYSTHGCCRVTAAQTSTRPPSLATCLGRGCSPQSPPRISDDCTSVNLRTKVGVSGPHAVTTSQRHELVNRVTPVQQKLQECSLNLQSSSSQRPWPNNQQIMDFQILHNSFVKAKLSGQA